MILTCSPVKFSIARVKVYPLMFWMEKLLGFIFRLNGAHPVVTSPPVWLNLEIKTPRILKLFLYPRTDPLRTNLSIWKNME